MKIYSVYDPEFKPYGQIIEGLERTAQEILAELKKTPVTKDVVYVAEAPALQELPAMMEISEHLYGGMPVQMGWCNGHNTKLNCMEYHRDSEVTLGTEEYILLLAKQHEIEDGILDTAKVKAFRVPAGVLVECYATTLHYAPCQADLNKGFQVLIVLPQGTNGDRPVISPKTSEDMRLLGKNKWVLAHPESSEAANGAYVGLHGKNIDIANLL